MIERFEDKIMRLSHLFHCWNISWGTEWTVDRLIMQNSAVIKVMIPLALMMTRKIVHEELSNCTDIVIVTIFSIEWSSIKIMKELEKPSDISIGENL